MSGDDIKKARFFVSTIFVILMVLGITFAILYFTTYLSNTRHVSYLISSLVRLAEFLFAGLSLLCYRKKVDNGFGCAVYMLMVIFSIPVLWDVLILLLYFVGIEIAPPPQQ